MTKKPQAKKPEKTAVQPKTSADKKSTAPVKKKPTGHLAKMKDDPELSVPQGIPPVSRPSQHSPAENKKSTPAKPVKKDKPEYTRMLADATKSTIASGTSVPPVKKKPIVPAKPLTKAETLTQEPKDSQPVLMDWPQVELQNPHLNPAWRVPASSTTGHEPNRAKINGSPDSKISATELMNGVGARKLPSFRFPTK